MNYVADILFAIIVLGMAWSMVMRARNKADYAEMEKEQVIEEIEERVEKEIIQRTEDLNNTAKWIDAQVAFLLTEKRNVQIAMSDAEAMTQWVYNESEALKNTKAQVEAIHNDAKVAIKQNKTQLFAVRESSLYVHNHYRKLVDILADLAMDAGQYDDETEQSIYNILSTANNNLHQVRTNFIHNFNLSPEDYQRRKIMMMGTHRETGESKETKFSKN